jgi:CheY-like chemotaxis protein
MFGPSRSVLIVEDDSDLRQAVAELLEDEGYECLHANNGIEALTVLKIQRPDLLVVDLIMPLMNGVDLLARLRHDGSYGDIPVIVMTAANDGMASVKLDVPVLHKPINVPVLRQMLARYCPLGNSSEAAAGDRRPARSTPR